MDAPNVVTIGEDPKITATRKRAEIDQVRDRFYKEYSQQAVRILSYLRSDPKSDEMGLWAELDGLLWMWAERRAEG